MTLKSSLDLVKVDVKGLKEALTNLNNSVKKQRQSVDGEEDSGLPIPVETDWGAIPYDDEIYDGIEDLK